MNFINGIFKPINDWLNGKKMIIGMIAGTGAFLSAVAVILGDGIQASDGTALLTAFGVWMTAIGAGHKLQKMEAGVKSILGK